jgi:tight adherence protein B
MSLAPVIVMALSGVAATILIALAIEDGMRGLARHRERTTRQTHASLTELFLFVDAELLYIAAALFALVVTLCCWLATHHVAIGIACGAASAILPTGIIHVLRKRRRSLLQRQLPDALLMLAGALRAGASLSTALQDVGSELPKPMSQEFSLMVREQRLGADMDRTLRQLAERINLSSVSLAVAAMRIAHESGGGLAEALERAAATLRSQLALESKIGALTAQGKLQAVIVGMLPLLLLVVLFKMEPQEMSLLLSTRAGWASILVMVAFESMGIFVIRRIVRIDV